MCVYILLVKVRCYKQGLNEIRTGQGLDTPLASCPTADSPFRPAKNDEPLDTSDAATVRSDGAVESSDIFVDRPSTDELCCDATAGSSLKGRSGKRALSGVGGPSDEQSE